MARKSGESRPLDSVVRYARLLEGELEVYEISKSELEQLEGGPPGLVHLSFGLALLPSALTVLITLQTVEIKQDRVYYTYVVAFWLLSVQGLISLARWWTTRGSIKSLSRTIRGRMPETPGIPERLAGPTRGGSESPPA